MGLQLEVLVMCSVDLVLNILLEIRHLQDC
jgi:hypothetical protein